MARKPFSRAFDKFLDQLP